MQSADSLIGGQLYPPFPSPRFPPLPSSLFPSLPLEIGLLNTSNGMGERCKLPQQKSNLVHFSLKI